MKTARQRLGSESEALADRLLRSRGYRIEARNVRCRLGELDLVAWEGETLCFVEVRTTSSHEWGGPLATITREKQRRLIRTARWYLARFRSLPQAIRFDVVAIDYSCGHRPAIELLQDAFTTDGFPELNL
jgi:putative endonuclease